MSQEIKKVSTSISDTNVAPSNPQPNPPAIPALTLSLSCNLYDACAAIVAYMNSENGVQAGNSQLENLISTKEKDLTTDFNNRENARYGTGKAGEKEREESKGHYETQNNSIWNQIGEAFDTNPDSGGVQTTTRKWVKGNSGIDTHASNTEYELEHLNPKSKNYKYDESQLSMKYNAAVNKQQAEIKMMDGNNSNMSNAFSQVAQGIQGLMSTFGAINSQEGNLARLMSAV